MKLRNAIALALLAASLGSAQAPRRISPADLAVQRKLALVIGNAKYEGAPLRNPPNDVRAVTAALERLGFTVTSAQDLTLRQMDQATGRFATQLKPGDLALFYYSGHGIQINQENYLLPVDFQPVSAADVRYGAISAAQVRDRLEESGARLRVMVLDACRNNPFRTTRGGPGGFAPMSSQAEGTLIAFATADNNTAEDNPAEANGLYTKHLIESLATPGLSLKQIFDHTRDSVYFGSARKQRPYTYDGIVGDLALSGAPAEVVRESPVILPPAKEPTTKSRINPKDGLKYVWVAPGSFRMGCSPRDADCGKEFEIPVSVTLTKGFYLGESEVTQAAYELVTGHNPSKFKGPDLPVEHVSWHDAQSYCLQIGGRLPTEAEWEYAARAGTTAATYTNVGRAGWYRDNSGEKTHSVKTKVPNALGLYDMLGNVFEWTSDWYADLASGGKDPQGPSSGTYKVLRGGSWDMNFNYIRASFRGRFVPSYRGDFIGFRCAMD